MKSGIVYVIITAILFTTHEPVSKLFAHEINPYAITAIRYFIAALVLLPFGFRQIKKDKLSLKPRDFLVMGSLGVLSICVSMVLLQVAVKIADSPALISIIFSSNSIFTILLSALFLNYKLTKTKVLGILLCIIGVLVSADLTKGSNITSVVLAVLSAITFSMYAVLCKKYTSRVPGMVQSGFSFLFGSAVLLLILLIGNIPIVNGITTSNLPGVLYISILVTGIGYWAYFSAMKVGGPQTAALAFFIKPILTPFAAFLINGIVPSPSVILALILVMIGVTLAGDTFPGLHKKQIEA